MSHTPSLATSLALPSTSHRSAWAESPYTHLVPGPGREDARLPAQLLRYQLPQASPLERESHLQPPPLLQPRVHLADVFPGPAVHVAAAELGRWDNMLRLQGGGGGIGICHWMWGIAVCILVYIFVSAAVMSDFFPPQHKYPRVRSATTRTCTETTLNVKGTPVKISEKDVLSSTGWRSSCASSDSSRTLQRALSFVFGDPRKDGAGAAAGAGRDLAGAAAASTLLADWGGAGAGSGLGGNVSDGDCCREHDERSDGESVVRDFFVSGW
jgi:hypothetical protein